VKRGSLDSRVGRLAERHRLPSLGREGLVRLVRGLDAEPDPPTAIRGSDEIIGRHLADSLEALQVQSVRDAHRLADIGSGVGFPGLALAVALPGAGVDLIEASRRKCEVIERLAEAAGAANARAIPARAEIWARGEGREAYDVATARAVGALAVLVEYAAPLLRIGGCLVAWKGSRDRDEERAAVAAAEELGIEYAEALPARPFAAARDRHLHRFVKRGPTPSRFPRRPGRAAKRPLGS
jgi:16S rRNA (guanine527-N7)-methyltransferase